MKIEELLNEEDKKYRNGLFVDLENLESQMSRIPVQFYDINYLMAKAGIAMETAKKDLKKTEKHLYRSFKMEADQKKIKLSEKALEARVEGNSLYMKAYENFLNIKSTYDLLKVKKEALDLKVKMLELSYDSLKNKMYLKSKLTK